jgi:hypothetical protein
MLSASDCLSEHIVPLYKTFRAIHSHRALNCNNGFINLPACHYNTFLLNAILMIISIYPKAIVADILGPLWTDRQQFLSMGGITTNRHLSLRDV